MSLKLKALTKSIWVFHAACSPCNNCDIEVLDLLTPRYDVERLGIVLVGSIRHADALLVTGVPNLKTKDRLQKIYSQAAKPCVVIAIGNCACGRIMFRESYNSPCDVDEIIPVDLYVPGCPPRPELLMHGLVLLQEMIQQKPGQAHEARAYIRRKVQQSVDAQWQGSLNDRLNGNGNELLT